VYLPYRTTIVGLRSQTWQTVKVGAVHCTEPFHSGLLTDGCWYEVVCVAGMTLLLCMLFRPSPPSGDQVPSSIFP